MDEQHLVPDRRRENRTDWRRSLSGPSMSQEIGNQRPLLRSRETAGIRQIQSAGKRRLLFDQESGTCRGLDRERRRQVSSLQRANRYC
jgi:hypothetical protein